MISKFVRTLFVALTLTGFTAVPLLAGEPLWIPTWYAAPEPGGPEPVVVGNRTLREIIRISAGGESLRLRLSNAYGSDPLYLDAVSIARAKGISLDGKGVAVTFNGRGEVMIAPGAYIVSDPVELVVADHAEIAVTIKAGHLSTNATLHDIRRGFVSDGPGFPMDSPAEPGEYKGAFPWLAEIEVSQSQARGAVIAFGDSITDGFGITPDAMTWPEALSRRFAAAGIPLSVVNAGISGNRILHHGTWARFGTGALARFDRDVLAQPNVSAVIVLIGINDLGHAAAGSPEYVSAQDVINGLSQMAVRAHSQGIRIYAGTLTPYRATVFGGYFSEEGETRRQTINAWIRETKVFDGVFDFDRALEDPARPGYLLPQYDVGDHLHPNNAGAVVIAGAIPLRTFDWAKK